MYLHTCINSSFGHCIFAAKTYCNPIMERLDEILEIIREIREDIAYMKRHRNMLCGTPILEVSEVCDLLKISDRQLLTSIIWWSPELWRNCSARISC